MKTVELASDCYDLLPFGDGSRLASSSVTVKKGSVALPQIAWMTAEECRAYAEALLRAAEMADKLAG